MLAAMEKLVDRTTLVLAVAVLEDREVMVPL
jgi:hypothetical protein